MNGRPFVATDVNVPGQGQRCFKGGSWMMSSPDKKKGNWKEQIFHEMVEYWINVCYLTLVFAAFTQYRRFLLAAHDITYTNYWVAVIEALILAKVIMIGDVVRLGRGLEQKPLIVSRPFTRRSSSLSSSVSLPFSSTRSRAFGRGRGSWEVSLISLGKGMNCSPILWSFSWLLSPSSASRSWGGCWERKK